MIRLTKPSTKIALIHRTSLYDSEEPPCKGAFKVELVQVDRRIVNSPEKVPTSKGTSDWWYSKGTNHRVENGNICRDMGWYKAWAIKIPSLTALLNLIRVEGKCIISITSEGFTNIEIYDTFRE